jgi:hypothetical protein
MKLIRSALLGLFCCLSLPALGAGTIFGLPLSQQLTENGEPMSGGHLYLYEADTSTPADAFETFSLTAGTELPHPIELDSSGRIPEFWVADGSYRVRLTDADGNEIFDISSTTAIGASSGTGGGGSGDVSEDSIFQTGDIMWQPVQGTRSGWVRANGRTIGSSSSGATERANADTETLFLFFWNNFSNTSCPVSGGRGGSAAADWAANKTIGLVDMRGRTSYGLDTMGNTAAGVIAAATAVSTDLGQEEKVIVQANLPNVNFAVTTTDHTHTGPSHTHTADGTLAVASHTHGPGSYTIDGTCTNCAGTTTVDSPGGAAVGTNASNGSVSGTVDGGVSGGTAPDVTGSTAASGTAATGAENPVGLAASGGSGTAFDTLSPGRAGSWYFKL